MYNLGTSFLRVLQLVTNHLMYTALTHCYLLTNAGSYNLLFFFQSSYSDIPIKPRGVHLDENRSADYMTFSQSDHTHNDAQPATVTYLVPNILSKTSESLGTVLLDTSCSNGDQVLSTSRARHSLTHSYTHTYSPLFLQSPTL